MIPLDFGKILFFVATFFGIYTSIYFLLTLVENWGRHITEVTKTIFPKVCIIVPCYNEEKTVGKTLNSLLELDYPADLLEIIVVDDGSSDGTFEAASKFKAQGIKVFKKKNGGKYTALNFALKKTNAQFVGALDADSTVAKDSLKKIVSRFDANNSSRSSDETDATVSRLLTTGDQSNQRKSATVMAVTPSMIIDKPRGFLRRIQSMEFIMGILLRRVFTDIGSQHVTPGPFTIYRKGFFEKYGYYKHAHNTEDIEVALRIQSHNFVIENATDAYVFTHGPSTFSSLYKQRLRWYAGFIKNVFDYRRLISSEHGNLGLFILPSSIISVFLLMVTITYALILLIKNLIVSFYHYWLIGFDPSQLFKFHFDTFFINTGPVAILGIIALLLSLFILGFAMNFSKEKNVLGSYVLFVVFYPWLFAFWWSISAIYSLTGRKIGWGHKSEELNTKMKTG